MKTLYLLRHAKSAWDNAGLSDHQRPLAQRGRRAAPLIGAALADKLEPTPVCASSACRAQQTLEYLCQGWPALADEEHLTEDDLYTFSADAVEQWVRESGWDRDRLFLIGHNPAFTDLANRLVGAPFLDNLPTAGFLQFSLDIDSWHAFAAGTGELEMSLFPRDLR